MEVTLELYTIVRLATGDEVVRWCICHNALPLGISFETRDEAARACRSWGWTIVGRSRPEAREAGAEDQERDDPRE